MQKSFDYLPGIAIFLAGVVAGVLSTGRRGEPEGTAGAERQRGEGPRAAAAGSVAESATIQELKRSVSNLESRLAAQETATAARLGQIETRLEEQTAKLAEGPSTAQIVAAMEQLLAKTMGSLDERLTTQAHSIEVLKTTVSQTDSLLERVLESLDSLQTYSESSEGTDEGLFSRAV